MLLLACGLVSYAQQSNLIVVKDELVLLIDLRSSKPNLFNVLTRAGVTSDNTNKVLKGDFSPIYNAGWKLKEKQKYVFQFNKPITVNLDKVPSKPYLITTNIIKTEGRPGYPSPVPYGLNKFSQRTVLELPSGVTRFFVPGNQKARKVQLSGDFNSWTTTKGLMTKTDSGWIADVRLKPGIHAYKFIINGKWLHDTNNLLSERD
ncbi:MAG: glycogen-binding domain-containing protein, partial [Mucilaginibacter sp.]